LSGPLGGLVHALGRRAQHARSTFESLVRQARAGPVLYADETGWRIGGHTAWLGVFTHPRLTVFAIR